MMRFYALQVAPNLFGEWCLLRVWGRIGRRGQMRTDWFETKQEAEDALLVLERSKRKRGYRERARRLPIRERSERSVFKGNEAGSVIVTNWGRRSTGSLF
jgi:predicted DNA-binding WGR domain protein